jgi:hypothetical protein
MGAIVVFLTIWFASPYTALHGIQQGIVDNNADAVSEYIDYEMLRSNTKMRVGTYMLEIVSPNMPKIFKDRASAQAHFFIEHAVDTYVRPEIFKQLTEIKPVNNSTQNDSLDIKHTWDIRWYTERKSLNEVRLHVASTNPKHNGREVVIHLRRISGITWKVVDIDPADWKDWFVQRLRRPLG